eukprot:351529-Chlamydomonas_euryale.AAC.2
MLGDEHAEHVGTLCRRSMHAADAHVRRALALQASGVNLDKLLLPASSLRPGAAQFNVTMQVWVWVRAREGVVGVSMSGFGAPCNQSGPTACRARRHGDAHCLDRRACGRFAWGQSCLQKSFAGRGPLECTHPAAAAATAMAPAHPLEAQPTPAHPLAAQPTFAHPLAAQSTPAHPLAAQPAPSHPVRVRPPVQNHGLDSGLDVHLIPMCKAALPEDPVATPPESVYLELEVGS